MSSPPHLRTSSHALLHLSRPRSEEHGGSALLSTSRCAAVDADAAAAADRQRDGPWPSGRAREAIYAQKEPNVANDVTKTYRGLAALCSNYDRDEISPQKEPPTRLWGRLRDDREKRCGMDCAPHVLQFKMPSQPTARKSPSSFLDTDCLLNFTTLCPLRLRRRRRGHLSLCASAVRVSVPLNQFSIPSYFFSLGRCEV